MTENQKKWRVFFAIELPEELKSRMAEHCKRLRDALPETRVSWEKPEKMHLTLKFVGEIKLARVEELSGAAERVTTSVKPFEITIEETGTFPPQGAARVLWLGVRDETGRLASLHRSLEDECAAAGFGREPRLFKPHLTIARIRAPRGARELAVAHREATFEPQAVRVSELILMRSELGPDGSRYTAVSRHPFLNM